jgi:hypothetical protein
MSKDEEILVRQAYDLLGGVDARDSKGLPRQAYLQGKEEKLARRALALLLLSDKPLDSMIRRQLAGLFDSDFEYSTRPNDEKNKAVERRIVFTRPSRRAIEHNRRLQLGFELWLRMGRPKKDEKLKRGAQTKAVEEMQGHYQSLDRKTITGAYEYAIKTKWVG